MRYKEIVDRSTLVLAGCFRPDIPSYTYELESRIQLNLPVFKEFKNIVVTYNKQNSVIKDNEFDIIKNLYRKYIPNCIFISQNVNRGWIFGGADLFKNSFSYVRDNIDSDYVWFLTEDFFIDLKFLDVDFGDEDYDYFGLPFFGSGSIPKDKDINEFIKEYTDDYLIPQYNFQIIKTDAISFFLMMESEEQDKKYKEWVQSSDGHDQRKYTIGAERQLYHTIVENKLNCKLIIEDLRMLVKAVRDTNMQDGAHKNVYFVDYGLCHFAWWQETLLAVEKERAMEANMQRRMNPYGMTKELGTTKVNKEGI
tara:strand:+ start:1221 stop:2147 length:927 start_codon:yes stop_codon:yes gene_type:complete